ncbi:MAG: outer membrane protein assembly factor BamB [Thiotrichales bacterium]|nr:MAG: outer membrane protein assembly factor BamB [Thiotrichales bacterium]
MKLLKTVLAVCLILLTASCGTKDNTPLPKALHKIKHSVGTKTLYEKKLTAGSSSTAQINLALSNKFIATADYKGNVVLLERNLKKVVWHKNLHARIGTTPCIGEHEIFVGSLSGEVFALNKTTGKITWKTQLNSSILAQPASSKNVLIVHLHNGKIIALNTKDGKTIWQHNFSNNPITIELYKDSAPVIHNYTLFVGGNDGNLRALALDSGNLVWQTPVIGASIEKSGINNTASNVSGVFSKPVIRDGVAYTTAYGGNVLAATISNGKILWQHSFSSANKVSADSSMVVAVNANGTVSAFDKYNGQILWENKKLQHRLLTAPLILKDIVIVGDYAGYLQLINATNGKILGRTRISKRSIVNAPVYNAQDSFYVMQQSGTLMLLKLTHSGK